MTRGDRLAELETRVAQLEDRLAIRRPEAEPADGTFWVLDGLRRRPEPMITYAGVVEIEPDQPLEWQQSYASAALLEQDWTELGASLSALAHPVRLRILQLVARGEASTAGELTRVADLGTTGQIYHHLRQLTAAGWLRATVRGRHEIPPERAIPLLVVLAAVG